MCDTTGRPEVAQRLPLRAAAVMADAEDDVERDRDRQNEQRDHVGE